MVECIPFNQAFALWIVTSIIMTIIISILNFTLSTKLKKYPMIAIGMIDGLKGLVLLLWALLSWAKIWKFSEPCQEYIPFSKFNILFI